MTKSASKKLWRLLVVNVDRSKDQANNERGKKARFSGGGDNQLFRGKTFNDFVLLCKFS